MTEIDSAIRTALGRRVPPFPSATGDDWADVLHRARIRPAAARRRALALAAVGALIAVLAMPGLGLGERLRELVGLGAGPGHALFSARLTAERGVAMGSFVVRVSRLAAHPSKRPVLFKGPPRWRLTFRGLSGEATAAHIHVAGASFTLCSPCTSGASGVLPSRWIGRLRGERAVFVDVHTRQAPRVELRGRVASRVRFPPRAKSPAETPRRP